MAEWNVSKPADTDLVRNHPGLARQDKTTLQTDLQVEHDVLNPAGGSTGRHRFPSGTTAARPANPPEGAIYFNTEIGAIEQWTGSVWASRAGSFPSGTQMVFRQAAAPTGWTRVVDAPNTDAVPILRMNGEVPGAGGSWTVAGLTAPSGGAHAHSTGASIGPTLGVASGAGETVVPGHTHNIASSGAHTHTVDSDGTWRPKHIDLIVASKA